MRIAERFATGRPVFSFEFFPPRTEAGFDALSATIRDLKPLDPDFVSVTWGAGGSTRRKTVELVIEIQRDAGLTAMAHLSCIGSTPDQLAATLDTLAAGSVENVLALGGDRPPGYAPPPGAFTHANELAAFVRGGWTFCLGGACYPETHPQAESPEADLRNLVRKVAAGVDFLITQLFFDNADYLRFVDRLRAARIDVPVLPGIIPITAIGQVQRLASLCRATIPRALERELGLRADDPRAVADFGVAYATAQSAALLDAGAPGIHLYTLNRSPATRAIVSALRCGRAGIGWRSRSESRSRT
jgi:methylenetetrahydrofolate reductase (NADH)